MKRYSVTIIGMGPRGLSILERLAAFARASSCLLQVNLVEPGECGPGVHGTGLAPFLLSNTAAGHLTIFPARNAVELAPVFATASLAEWARAEGYRRFGERVHQVGPGPDLATEAGAPAGEELADDDVLPRSLLGRYLVWAYRRVAAALPPTVRLSHLRQRAVDMFQQPDGNFVVELDSGFSVNSDFVFLATGHSRSNLTDEESWCRKFAQDHARYNSKLVYLRHPYPLDKLSALGSDARVGISGLGLSAHDVVAALTVGRGGRFVAAGSGVRYVASGQEPRLLMFSRSGLPALAQPPARSATGARPGPRFFTREAVCALREAAMRERASVQLDFDRELLPLLMKEMSYAWRCAADGGIAQLATVAGIGFVPSAGELAGVEALLFPLRGRCFDSGAAFSTFITCLLADDLSEARRGSLASPAKAAAEALAEARPVLQEAIEHGGLSANSHRKFLSVYQSAFNRVAYGPPSARNEQLLALIEAGVLEMAAGPNPAVRIDEELSQFALHTRTGGGNDVTCLDALVIARLDAFSPETDDAVFMRNLLKRGTVRPYYNGTFHPGGIDIDAAHHPISQAGRVFPNVWASGCLVEGPHYFTQAMPRPHSHARPVLDADRCVRELFSTIAERDSAGAGAVTRARPRLVSGAQGVFM